MKGDIEIKNAIKDPECSKVIKLYQDKKIQETFGGFRKDRLIASEYIFLICSNKKNIGFILLVPEKYNIDYLMFDIGIIEKYHGQGFGKKTLEIFKNNILPQISKEIHIQVRQDDIVTNKIISILDLEYLETIDDSNFYKIVNNQKIKKKTYTNKN